MVYTPPLPTTYATNMEQMIQDAQVRQLIANAQAQEASLAAQQGATATVVEAAATDGVADVGTEVATSAVLAPAAPVALAVGTGVALGEGLRQIPGWDHAMHALGADLIDGIFGLTSPSGLTPEVKLYVADYVQHRFITQRQREAAINSLAEVRYQQSHRKLVALSRATVAVSRGARAGDARTLTSARTYADQRAAAAIAYANARAHNVGVAAEQYADRVGAGARRYAHDIAAQAQRNAEAHTTHVATNLQHDIMVATAAATAASIAAHLKPITSALTQMKSQLDKLTEEAQTCTEPMCETVGPESEWGKLLKKFKPSLILALIAAAILTDPEAAERAAVDAAETLGPPIQKIIEAVLIPLGHGPITQPGEITGALGLPPIPGVGV
jgi:hypothetical protein